jgi:hypothetical protein
LIEKNNIEHEKETLYAYHYLGPVKRPMLVIANEIRILLIDTHLPEELWVKLVKRVVYLRNRSLTRTLDQSIPYECLYKRKPDVSHLRIISSTVYCHEMKKESGPNRRIKLEPRARKCRLIKYEKGTTQLRVWNPANRQVKKVTFTRIDKTDTVVSQAEADQGYNHHQANQEDTDYTDAKASKTSSESDESTDSESDNLDQEESNEKDTESESEDDLTNDNVLEARRIRNLKKFQVIVPKRAIILLVNSTTHDNKEIREPESLTETQLLPQ